MADGPTSRRAVLGAIGGVGGLSLAGCLGTGEGGSGGAERGTVARPVPVDDDESDAEPRSESAYDVDFDEYEPLNGTPIGAEPIDADGTGPPLADRGIPIAHDPDTYREHALSGGVGQDGIPSIDDPSFVAAADSPKHYQDGEPVFGVVWNGEARAYTQAILVWHEVVNDVLDGQPVAITYCPLTGTAQGFRRGDVEFGVSGRLVNSNLVLYDRGTESWWPQVLAAGIDGPHAGDALAEFEVTWTTVGRWTRAYPETEIVTAQTGYARDYGTDPYGEYNPRGAYYAEGPPMFDVMHTDGALEAKTVVIGTRTADGALAVPKARLRETPVVEATVGDVPYVAVYDRWLDTAYTYRNPEALAVDHDAGRYLVDGEPFLPHDLPLERTLRLDAFWFAWAAFYPDTTLAP